DRNRSHWSTSKTPSYTKSVSWQHHPIMKLSFYLIPKKQVEGLLNKKCFYHPRFFSSVCLDF
ncbi:hypothetical protein, partial [Klebsiella pneumoniae]|uniref:hypothetical protein n=1 Tax=Klebsiella pneumoniae TaxID=573 RepID=UPI001F4B5B7E